MKTPILFLVALSLILPACTNLPAVQGEFISKDGRIKVYPDGKFEIVIEPRSGK
jgi:hypothetical protein